MEVRDMDARGKGMYIACIVGGGIALPYAVKAFCWCILKIAGWL